VSSVHEDFMSSPTHHHNIVLPNYDAIGVGVVDGKNGSIWVAHVFAKLATTPVPAPKTVTVAARKPASAPATHAPVSHPANTGTKVARSDSASKPAPTPIVKRPASADPNALMGGVVQPRDL